ncbi:MAG: tyrosine-type recombinase/integrase [Crenarchaeota archaeon]|jgi:integrase/recombinase XerD|nr:tyrosine-type recombinase/integrase [Thermoproteota archaeon]
MDINVILSESFEKWLKTLEYAPSTVYASVRYVNDFFFYLKASEITKLEAIQPQTLTNYHKHLQSRKNKRQNGSLSNNYITSNINAIKRFSRYLQETGKPFFEVEIKTRPDKETSKIILTQSEIKALYKACDNSILGIRDRAILSIYYGCGLRRSEGVSLNVSDVLLKEKRIHIRQGKGYKERYIPMTEAVKEDIENYIYVAREKIRSFKNTKPEALFLSMQVNRLCGNAIIERVHKLAEVSKLQKDIGIHTLRHSIATHLLQSGMTLEEVSQFLGHSSLESTQIYTHLANA